MIHQFDSHTIFTNAIYEPALISNSPLVFEVIYARRNKLTRSIEKSDIVQVDITNMRIYHSIPIPYYINQRIMLVVEHHMKQSGLT